MKRRHNSIDRIARQLTPLGWMAVALGTAVVIGMWFAFGDPLVPDMHGPFTPWNTRFSI